MNDYENMSLSERLIAVQQDYMNAQRNIIILVRRLTEEYNFLETALAEREEIESMETKEDCRYCSHVCV